MCEELILHAIRIKDFLDSLLGWNMSILLWKQHINTKGESRLWIECFQTRKLLPAFSPNVACSLLMPPHDFYFVTILTLWTLFLPQWYYWTTFSTGTCFFGIWNHSLTPFRKLLLFYLLWYLTFGGKWAWTFNLF